MWMLSASVCILLFQNCSNGFQATDGFTSLSLSSMNEQLRAQGKTLYAQNCANCHGALAGSTKLGKSAGSISTAIMSVAQMSSLSFLTELEKRAIAVALSPESSTPTTNDQGQALFACVPGQVPKTPMLKLTNRELTAALGQVLDRFSTNLKSDGQLNSLLSALPTDVLAQDRTTLKEQSLLVTQANVNAVFNLVFYAGTLVAQNPTALQNYPGTSGCLAQATISQACHKLFVKELGSHAFRRTLSQADVDSLATKFWDGALSKNDLVTATFAALLSMPDFTYKVYDRGTLELGSSVLALSATELATKLAFFLTGAPPDSTLRGFGENGKILEDAILQQEIERLLQTPASRSMVQRLFRESYGYDTYDSFMYNASYVGGMNLSNLREVLNQELDHYFPSIVLDQRGSFEQLMTSTSTQITDQRLATIYGVSTSTTTLPNERAGFLNRAAMLTKRSGFETSPIKRGLNVVEHVLCQHIGEPPPTAPTSLPTLPTGTYLSTRARTHALSEVPSSTCIGCHTKINNLGFPFERFDTFGRLRMSEGIFDAAGNLIASVPVDTRASTNEVLFSGAVTVNDSTDLSHELAVSDKAMMCFAKHLKQFESRLPVSSEANCQMNAALGTLYGKNGTQGSIADAIKAFVSSPDFRKWNFSN